MTLTLLVKPNELIKLWISAFSITSCDATIVDLKSYIISCEVHMYWIGILLRRGCVIIETLVYHTTRLTSISIRCHFLTLIELHPMINITPLNSRIKYIIYVQCLQLKSMLHRKSKYARTDISHFLFSLN